MGGLPAPSGEGALWLVKKGDILRAANSVEGRFVTGEDDNCSDVLLGGEGCCADVECCSCCVGRDTCWTSFGLRRSLRSAGLPPMVVGRSGRLGHSRRSATYGGTSYQERLWEPRETAWGRGRKRPRGHFRWSARNYGRQRRKNVRGEEKGKRWCPARQEAPVQQCARRANVDQQQ